MKKAFVACLGLLLSTALPASATLLGTDWAENSSLYSIDTTSGNATLIGPIFQSRMIGLVVDTDSTIYAISEETNSKLWTLDSTTGAASLVGSLGFNLQEGDMTIDPNSGQMYVADGIGDRLYIVNKATAAASLVGSFGLDGRDVSGLQFIDGTLYGLALRNGNPDILVSVNPMTGAATTIGLTGTNFGVIAAMGRDPANDTVFIAGPASTFGSDNQLYSVNLTTGAATLVGSLNGVLASVSGFSVSGEPGILLPEPGTGLLLVAALVSLATLRKRH